MKKQSVFQVTATKFSFLYNTRKGKKNPKMSIQIIVNACVTTFNEILLSSMSKEVFYYLKDL